MNNQVAQMHHSGSFGGDKKLAQKNSVMDI
jgi:hypothetical protein